MTDSTLSSSRPWPHWPNLQQFKRQAKELLKAYRSGEPGAVAEVARHEQAPDPAAFASHDAQRVLARSYGFASWQKLKTYVETIEKYRQPLEVSSDNDADRFLRLACISYFDSDHPARREQARQLLAEQPHIARANLYTAAAVGDVAAVNDFLKKNADVHTKGGPFHWEPLLYAAYSRLDSQTDEHSTLNVTRMLIAHGADANAGFLWDWGGPFPCLFTALTGVLGLGESDVFRTEGTLYQPPHPQWREFARLLLAAGADPNDNQGLYNRMQYPDDEHLRLLFEYGLGQDQGGPWFQRFFQHWPRGEHSTAAGYVPISPSDLLAYQLRYAVKANYFERVKLLVENGADVNGRRQHAAGGRVPYAEAVYYGHQEIADYLVAQGATPIALSPADEFAAACNRGDADRARELLASIPSLLDHSRELLILAAEEGRVDHVRLLVELGFDVNGQAGRPSPLYCAALAGQLETVRLLVEFGADMHARDPDYNATPLDAANYKGQQAVAEYLRHVAGDCN